MPPTENDSFDLRYATCPAPCSTPTWTSGSVVTGERPASIFARCKWSWNGAPTWLDATSMVVQYGTCSASCTDAANWSIAAIEQVAIGPVDYGFYWTSLALGPGVSSKRATCIPGTRRCAQPLVPRAAPLPVHGPRRQCHSGALAVSTSGSPAWRSVRTASATSFIATGIGSSARSATNTSSLSRAVGYRLQLEILEVEAEVDRLRGRYHLQLLHAPIRLQRKGGVGIRP
jgi:hypothetical protein